MFLERKLSESKYIVGTILMVLVVFLSSTSVRSEDKAMEKDPEFMGQILTLTEPKVEVGESKNPRFKDNQDGTVSDLDMKLIWVKDDSYQRLKKWINWDMAQDYIKELNDKKFGGANNWRLPSRKELASLFDESVSIPWNYYWTKNEVHLDPIFGNSHCCYWTGEEYKNEMAWGFNFIRGKAYLSKKGGNQLSLTVIRAVRELEMTSQKQ